MPYRSAISSFTAGNGTVLGLKALLDTFLQSTVGWSRKQDFTSPVRSVYRSTGEDGNQELWLILQQNTVADTLELRLSLSVDLADNAREYMPVGVGSIAATALSGALYLWGDLDHIIVEVEPARSLTYLGLTDPINIFHVTLTQTPLYRDATEQAVTVRDVGWITQDSVVYLRDRYQSHAIGVSAVSGNNLALFRMPPVTPDAPNVIPAGSRLSSTPDRAVVIGTTGQSARYYNPYSGYQRSFQTDAHGAVKISSLPYQHEGLYDVLRRRYHLLPLTVSIMQVSAPPFGYVEGGIIGPLKNMWATGYTPLTGMAWSHLTDDFQDQDGYTYRPLSLASSFGAVNTKLAVRNPV